MNKKIKANYDRPGTVLGKGTVFESTKLVSKESIQISGKFIGDMEVEGSVVVASEGLVRGNIKAIFVLVAGEVEGNIEAAEQVHLGTTAKVKGNVSYKSIVIDEGAIIHGQLTCSGQTIKKVEKTA